MRKDWYVIGIEFISDSEPDIIVANSSSFMPAFLI